MRIQVGINIRLERLQRLFRSKETQKTPYRAQGSALGINELAPQPVGLPHFSAGAAGRSTTQLTINFIPCTILYNKTKSHYGL